MTANEKFKNIYENAYLQHFFLYKYSNNIEILLIREIIINSIQNHD